MCVYTHTHIQFSSIQLLSHVRLFVSPCIAARQASLSVTNSRSLPKPMSIESVMPSSHLSSPSPPAPNPSQHQGLFHWVSSSHEVAKVLEFQPQHHSFQWTPRTDLLRMDWLDLLAVQGTLKSFLQHHSSKASILQRSALFTVQPLHPYMTTGKTMALTRWTFVTLITLKCLDVAQILRFSSLRFRLTLFLERGGLVFLGVAAPYSLFTKPECSSDHRS